MSHSTGSPRRPASKRAAPLPYPELPDHDAGHALYWRASWLRAVAEHAAFQAHTDRVWGQRGTTGPLKIAFIVAGDVLHDAVKDRFDRLVRNGGLLYAWLPEGGAA